MSGLVDPQGRPLTYAAAKEKIVSPRVGDAFGQWAGRDSVYLNMPGGAVMQFDLSRLTLADFRGMRHNYQLGASLNVLTFVMHQIDWSIDCENQEIKDLIEHDLTQNWTPLVRALSQSFWAGYSPIAVNYKNARDGYIRIDKFKDLVPEECRIKWEKIEGWAPAGKPKPIIYRFDGMYQNNSEIPVENTLWYPLLMENGDHYGRKLLKPAFPSWFFSQLIHLFANRYFERFGEPLPVGRARFDDEVDMGDGTVVNGKKAMEAIVNTIRNRAAVVLPSDRDPNTKEYDYDIEFLESQMRGADFERYLSRLDEEMSLAVFTPVLLFRTADVGSYNLGQAHLRIFQQVLNAIAGDFQFYIQNYIVDRLRVLNFGQDSPEARWVYRRQGGGDVETYKELMNQLVSTGRAGPDLEELAAIVGLTFKEFEQVTEPPAEPLDNQDPENDPNDPNEPTEQDPKQDPVKARRTITPVLSEAVERASREYGKGSQRPAVGYRKRVVTELRRAGWDPDDAESAASAVYARINGFVSDVAEAGLSADEFHAALRRVTDEAIEREVAA